MRHVKYMVGGISVGADRAQVTATEASEVSGLPEIYLLL